MGTEFCVMTGMDCVMYVFMSLQSQNKNPVKYFEPPDYLIDAIV